MVASVKEWPTPPPVFRYAASGITWVGEEVRFDQSSVLIGCKMVNCEVYLADGVTLNAEEGCQIIGNRFHLEATSRLLSAGKPMEGERKFVSGFCPSPNEDCGDCGEEMSPCEGCLELTCWECCPSPGPATEEHPNLPSYCQQCCDDAQETRDNGRGSW